MRWQREEIIGQGRFSSVYRARDEDMYVVYSEPKLMQQLKKLAFNFLSGQPLAVKQVYISGLDDPMLPLLEREVRIMTGLSHPNVISLIGYEIKGNLFCILLDYMPNGTIAGLRDRGIVLNEKQIRKLTR